MTTDNILTKPIAYLEDPDIDKNGDIINSEIPTHIPVVIMIQATWCPHCQNAKGSFQDFANKNKGKVFCATIEANGERKSEQELGKRVSSFIKDFRGFPHYALYINGKLQDKEIEGRSVQHLEKFCGI